MEAKLSREQIKKAGDDVINETAKLFQCMQNVKELMDGSKSFFNSPAGDNVRKKFTASAQEFEVFRKVLNEYGQFLIDYAKTYDTLETKINEVASQIPNL